MGKNKSFSTNDLFHMTYTIKVPQTNAQILYQNAFHPKKCIKYRKSQKQDSKSLFSERSDVLKI